MRKICPACKTEKDISEFGKDKQTKSGIACYCSDCHNERTRSYYRKNTEIVCARTKKYYFDNLEKYSEWQRQWNAKHPEKIKEYNAKYPKMYPEKYTAKAELRHARKMSAPGDGVTEEQWHYVLELYGRQCLKCRETERITMDHVVPLSRGGAHDVSNIQPLCMSCNCRKHTTTADYRYIADWT